MQLAFDAVAESRPGRQWQTQFNRFWPNYRSWFLSRGGRDRPALPIAIKRLRRYMPELEPTFDRLVELAGGDETAARFLSCYRPPEYLGGCSQAVLRRAPGPMLVRNYDLDPNLNEGLILHTAWNGRRVMATSEFLWGVADGMNDAGLALSLAYGGRKTVGDGFGICLILRYILEFCDRVGDAVDVLQHVPSHMAYNVTLVDRDGASATVHVAPDRPAVVTRVPVATNHQPTGETVRPESFTHSRARERLLKRKLADGRTTQRSLLAAFQRPPLYSTNYSQGFGTLYTAAYRPLQGIAEWRWPGMVWRQSFEHFEPGHRSVRYSSAGARVGSHKSEARPLPTVTDDDPFQWADWAKTGDFSLESVLRQTWRTVRGALPGDRSLVAGRLEKSLAERQRKG